MPSMSRRLRPLSMTCVRPRSRGFGSRARRSRKPSEPSKDPLQSLVRFCLDVVVERVAVRVDADGERPEVLDAELPEALRHELLPGDLLDLLDLGRLERRGLGSIASSGKPPLPQIPRTPYCAPSGSVNRTMRADVVVPMQSFSYRPSATLRTFGAVWSRNAPRRSIGGSPPWAKILFCGG